MTDENYKEFDTTSIVSRDTVSIGKVSIRKRELIFVGIAVIALIIAIILAIVLAVEVGNCRSSSTPTTSAVSGSQDGTYCSTLPCLKTAYYEKSIMNESADPCVNFYMFACGGYANVYTPNPIIPDQTAVNQILSENIQKLIYLLQYEPERNTEESYERKLRHFISSCTNHFDKMELRGRPFVNQVLGPLGDTYLLGKWNASNFNFVNLLKKVHIDFWTPAFFAIMVITDSTDWNKKVIQLDFGGTGLNHFNYLPPISPRDKAIQQAYKNYITNLTQLIVRDSGAASNTDVINQFAVDAFEVESAIANASLNSRHIDNPHDMANRMTLGALSLLTNKTLDLVDYFNTQFPTLSGKFTQDTYVAVLKENFFHKLGPILNNYLATDEGKRKLHNYLVWQLINRYAPYLNWEYVHARRLLDYAIRGEKDDSSGFSNCFRMAESTMREALGAVFVKDYVDKRDTTEAIDILDKIREELLQSLANLNWMSSENKNSAIKKIKESLYKIGFPDYLVDDKYLDNLYSGLIITDDDYFGNVIRMNSVFKKRFGDMIATPDSKTVWVYHVLDPVIEYFNPWHELIMTAAMLQNPLFAYNGPDYYKFGGIGAILASNLIHAVDEYGSYYKLDKSNSGNWWTDFTQQHYEEIKNCSIEAHNSSQLGPFAYSEKNTIIFDQNEQNELSYHHAPELLSDASGLKLSYKAYKAKMAKGGTDELPAGLTKYTLDQMFFIAFAQANCQNTPDNLKYTNLVYRQQYPSDYKVNLAVSQVQEFGHAFQCQKGAPMVAEKTCTLF